MTNLSVDHDLDYVNELHRRSFIYSGVSTRVNSCLYVSQYYYGNPRMYSLSYVRSTRSLHSKAGHQRRRVSFHSLSIPRLLVPEHPDCAILRLLASFMPGVARFGTSPFSVPTDQHRRAERGSELHVEEAASNFCLVLCKHGPIPQ